MTFASPKWMPGHWESYCQSHHLTRQVIMFTLLIHTPTPNSQHTNVTYLKGVLLELNRCHRLVINFNKLGDIRLAFETAIPWETEKSRITVTLKIIVYSRNKIVNHIGAQMSRLNRHTLIHTDSQSLVALFHFWAFVALSKSMISQDSGIRTSVLLFNSFVLWAMLLKFHESQYLYLPNVIPLLEFCWEF